MFTMKETSSLCVNDAFVACDFLEKFQLFGIFLYHCIDVEAFYITIGHRSLRKTL